MGRSGSLNVLEVLQVAATRLIAQRGAFVRGLALPGLVLVSFDYFLVRIASSSLSNLIAALVGSAPFMSAALASYATTASRLAIGGPELLPNAWSRHWSWRETRVLVWTWITGVLSTLTGFGLYLAVMLIAPQFVAQYTQWIVQVVTIPAAYVGARVGLSIPASAMDRRFVLSEVWSWSRANGWRLGIIALVPVWTSKGIAMAFETLPDTAVVFVCRVLVLWLIGVVGVVSAAVSFQRLLPTHETLEMH